MSGFSLGGVSFAAAGTIAPESAASSITTSSSLLHALEVIEPTSEGAELVAVTCTESRMLTQHGKLKRSFPQTELCARIKDPTSM